jgi:hypothetical protein
MKLGRCAADSQARWAIQPSLLKGAAARWIIALIRAAFTGATLFSLLRAFWDAE